MHGANHVLIICILKLIALRGEYELLAVDQKKKNRREDEHFGLCSRLGRFSVIFDIHTLRSDTMAVLLRSYV